MDLHPLRTTRSWATWAVAHGMSRRLLLRAAGNGDLMARLSMDPEGRADPFGSYEELRARGRVVTGELVSGTVDHAVCDAVLRSDDFGVAGGHRELPVFMQRALARLLDPWAASPVDPPSMLAVDPPQHTRYRRLVSRAFTARSVAGLEDTVTDIAERLVDRLADGPDRVDLVDQFAARLPVAVIAELLGVPDEQHTQLLDWGNVAAITLDPGLTWRDFRRAEEALRALHLWFDEHVRTLRAHPGDDLLSRLAVMDGDDRLTEQELRATGLLLLGAGFETTVNLIGNAVVQLESHPDARALAVAEPDHWVNVVEEVLRYDSPVQLTLRQAYVDTLVDGVAVPKNQIVLAFLGGANRDPAVFDDPQRFDITRANADRHLAFSGGVHYCLGASLARLEARVALEVLYSRFGDLALAGPPVRRGTRVLRGYEHVPVALHALSASQESARDGAR